MLHYTFFFKFKDNFVNTSFSNNPRAEERLSNVRQDYSQQTNNKHFKFILTIFWLICHFVFYFIQQLAEILAPLLLVTGILWKILPIATESLIKIISSTDLQTGNILKHNNDFIPYSIMVAGHSLSAGKLIIDSLLLLILTSLCATLTAYLGRKI